MLPLPLPVPLLSPRWQPAATAVAEPRRDWQQLASRRLVSPSTSARMRALRQLTLPRGPTGLVRCRHRPSHHRRCRCRQRRSRRRHRRLRRPPLSSRRGVSTGALPRPPPLLLQADGRCSRALGVCNQGSSAAVKGHQWQSLGVWRPQHACARSSPMSPCRRSPMSLSPIATRPRHPPEPVPVTRSGRLHPRRPCGNQGSSAAIKGHQRQSRVISGRLHPRRPCSRPRASGLPRRRLGCACWRLACADGSGAWRSAPCASHRRRQWRQ